jgi:hypothetical protein
MWVGGSSRGSVSRGRKGNVIESWFERERGVWIGGEVSFEVRQSRNRVKDFSITIYLYNDQVTHDPGFPHGGPGKSETQTWEYGMDESRDFGNLQRSSSSSNVVLIPPFPSLSPCLAADDDATRASYESGFLETYATERVYCSARGMACAVAGRQKTLMHGGRGNYSADVMWLVR